MSDQSDITPAVSMVTSPDGLIIMSRSLATSILQLLDDAGITAECTLEMSHVSQQVIMLRISLKAHIELETTGLTDDHQSSSGCLSVQELEH